MHEARLAASIRHPNVVTFMGIAKHKGDFYIICPDNESPRKLDELRVQWSADDIIKNRPPLSRWHADYKDEYEQFVSARG